MYAFGVTLNELFTAGRPYSQGLSGGDLARLVCEEDLRPAFPMLTPAPFKELATRCWARDPETR